jgi:hypothetical protein
MTNKIFYIHLLLLVSLSLKAQENINYPVIDRETYSQYLQKDWKGLLKTGKISLKNDIEFYYLDVRMGIAFYELKKYRKAIPYLEKAREQNRSNELVTEYLYYAYLFSGRSNDARKLTKVLSAELKTKIGIGVNPIINAINIDLRFENFDDYYAAPSSSELLEQDVRTDYSYFAFGVEHLIKENSRFFWSYSKIKTDITIFDIGDSNEQISNDSELSQNQFYFSYQNQLKYGLNLVLAANILNIVSKGSVLIPSGGWGPGGGGTVNAETRYVSNQILGYAGLRKDFANFQIGLGSSFSNLDKVLQIQPGLDLSWYPLSNTNIYLTSHANYRMENANSIWDNEMVIKQSLGFRLLTFYIEPSITFGNIINYTDVNAYIVYNDNDVIKDMYEVLIYGSFFKNKLNLFFKYQDYNKTNTYLLNGVDNEITYKNQTLTGGIKWNF